MKKLLSAIIFLIFLVSCSPTYYYTQVASPNDYLTRKPTGDFVFENDSLWIAYMFAGENAPIGISIGNKLNVPLFIDWNKSQLLIGENRYPYIRTKNVSQLHRIEISPSIDSETEQTIYPSTVAGKSINQWIPKGVDVIPPGYSFSAVLAWINPDVIAYKGNNKYLKHKMADKKGTMHSVGRLNFDQHDSPLRFSSIISYNFENDTSISNFFSDFYVKNVIKSNLNPDNLALDFSNRGDIFYTYIPPNYSAGQIIGATALTMGFIILDATLNSNAY